jgi:hypothetical protein
VSIFYSPQFILTLWAFTQLLDLSTAEASVLSCKNLFDKYQEEKVGAQFLMDRNANFHSTTFVKRAMDKNSRKAKNQIQKPVEQVAEWLRQLSAIHTKASQSPYMAKKLKETFYTQTVIKPENVPSSYFDLQVRIARERGLGTIQITKRVKSEMIESLIKDQKASLESWLDYFLSADTSMYPPWVKYWMLSGVVKLSKFNPENGSFANRDKNTVAPFIELNREALAYVVDAVLLKANRQSLEEIQDPAMVGLLDGANFGKLYGHSLLKAGVGRDGKFKTNVGQWVTYPQGSNPRKLVGTLKGKNTGWCTAGLATAELQLKAGDFHVYYSLDERGMPVLPRIAIRMEGESIAEIRGVDKEQNLDGQLATSDILSVKLDEFGDRGKVYLRKEQDMRRLTSIESKHNIGQPLSVDELKFLYEIEDKIKGFGYGRDPRIQQLISQRNVVQDLSLIFDVSPDSISIEQNSKQIRSSRFHFGDWTISDQKTANFYFIERIHGNVFIKTDVLENVSFPKSISGQFDIGSGGRYDKNTPRVVKNVIFPNVSEMSLTRLETLENVTFPSSMDTLTLTGPRVGPSNYLKPVKVTLPKSIRQLTLSVDSATELTLPESGYILFTRLNTYKGLKIPENFAGTINIPIKDLENLIIPDSFQGTINFQRVTQEIPTLEGLVIPKNFKGQITKKPFLDTMPGDYDGFG